jgi:hypothetical protein
MLVSWHVWLRRAICVTKSTCFTAGFSEIFMCYKRHCSCSQTVVPSMFLVPAVQSVLACAAFFLKCFILRTLCFQHRKARRLCIKAFICTYNRPPGNTYHLICFNKMLDVSWRLCEGGSQVKFHCIDQVWVNKNSHNKFVMKITSSYANSMMTSSS